MPWVTVSTRIELSSTRTPSHLQLGTQEENPYTPPLTNLHREINYLHRIQVMASIDLHQ